jgi:hypothetical protein
LYAHGLGLPLSSDLPFVTFCCSLFKFPLIGKFPHTRRRNKTNKKKTQTQMFALRPQFWENELGAPMLDRNHQFLTQETSTGIAERAASWPGLVDISDDTLGTAEAKDIAKLERIFAADAERTFKSTEFRHDMVALLQRLGKQLGDYHQGLGYISSFLSLTNSAEDVFKIVMRLNQEKYMAGYFRGTPETFVRDARVLERLLAKSNPDLASHLKTCGVPPEAYAQKWFIGLCLHVLPFAQLFEFYDEFLAQGWVFLFKFGLAVYNTLSARIIDAGRDISKIFSLLRLDPSLFPGTNQEFFQSLMRTAKQTEVDVTEVQRLREEEWVILQAQLERVRQREKELEDEDDDEELLSDSDDEDGDDDDD